MVVDNESITKTIVSYVDDVKTAMPIERVYLFGSHAKGNAHRHSDIDLCFFSSSFDNQNPFDVVRKLLRMTRKYKGLDIEPHVFTMSDMKTDNPFVKEILRTGKEIY